MDKDEFSGDGPKNVLKEGAVHIGQPIRREEDSLDDFEHLGHDISPLKEKATDEISDLLGGLKTEARDVQGVINTGVEKAATAVHKVTDDTLQFVDPLIKSEQPVATAAEKMDSNLLEMGDTFPDRKEADDKLDKFLQEMGSFASPKHQEPPENLNKDAHFDGFKSATQNFMDNERELIQPKSSSNEFLDRYSDSEPEDNEADDFRPSKYQDFPKKAELPESDYSEQFKDLEEFESPKKESKPSAPTPEPVNVSHFDPIQPVKAPEPAKEKLFEIPQETHIEKAPEPVREKTPEPIKPAFVPEPIKHTEPVKAPEPAEVPKPPAKRVVCPPKPKVAAIEAEAIFCKMGLDAWFNPERLNPRVESLIYWRDSKKSGPVFGGVLVVLLALTYFSLISVIAYLSLLVLTGTISFRIYKNIVQAVQKTGDGHPFKEFLEFNVALPQDKVKEITEVAVAHLNAAIVELRRLFLVEDLIDSIKFGVLLWTLTYLGSWFNGMTLVIITWVALFTLPKIYETNKTQIDANLDIVRTKVAEITSKVKAAIPIGKKAEEKKEQ